MGKNKSKNRIPLPREHGAWGILLGSFFAATAMGKDFSIALIFYLLALTLFYASRQALLNLFRKKEPFWNFKWFLAFSGTGFIFLIVSAATARFWNIIEYTFIMPLFLLIELELIRKRKQMTFMAQFVGTIGLTLAAPLTLILLQKQVSNYALIIWLISILFFTSGLLFVRYQIALMTKNKASQISQRRYQKAIILYHIILFVFLLGLSMFEDVSVKFMFAFLPLFLHVGLSLSRDVVLSNLKFVGWLEIAQTIIFVSLLFWVF